MHTPACFTAHMGIWAIQAEVLSSGVAMYRDGRLPTVQDPASARMSETQLGGIWSASKRGERLGPVDAGDGAVYVRHAHGLATISLSGTLMKGWSKFGGTSTVAARRALRASAADDAVKSILLVIESPGGTVAGTKELADEVAAVDRYKPVSAHLDDLGASAAYWIASQARTVSTNATALVGSIGVAMVLEDRSKRMEAQGIEVIPFVTGPLKAAGSYGTEVTKEHRAHFQGLVDSAMRHFSEAVMAGRGFSHSDLAAVATGGVFPAEEALHLGLVDRINSLDSAAAHALAEITGERRSVRARRADRVIAKANEILEDLDS